MNEGLISKRYAKALYEYTAERGDEDAFYKRMQTLSDVLRYMPKLRRTLENPMVSSKNKKALLQEATGTQPEQSYLDFVSLILKNKREPLLQNIALSYQILYRKRKNISIVKITSAKQMNDSMLERIRKQVTARTHGDVEFSTHIDEKMGGGFIFQMNDIRLDASVKGQLELMRRQLIK